MSESSHPKEHSAADASTTEGPAAGASSASSAASAAGVASVSCVHPNATWVCRRHAEKMRGFKMRSSQAVFSYGTILNFEENTDAREVLRTLPYPVPGTNLSDRSCCGVDGIGTYVIWNNLSAILHLFESSDYRRHIEAVVASREALNSDLHDLQVCYYIVTDEHGNVSVTTAPHGDDRADRTDRAETRGPTSEVMVRMAGGNH